MRKQAVSTLTRMMICLLLIIGGLASAYAQEVVYSLAQDAEIQGMAIGSTFEGTDWLQRSGDPALTIYNKGGTKAIQVLGRDVDWDAMDLRNLQNLPAGFNYQIVVSGTGQAGGKMKLSQNTGPWGTHADVNVDAQGNYRLEASFTHEEITKERAVRIQSEGTSFNYTIDSIVITANPAGPKRELVYSLSADPEIQGLANGANFEGVTWLLRSGDPALTIYTKDGAKAIRVLGRDVDWDAMDFRNLADLPAGFDYHLIVTGTATAGGKMKLSQTTGPWGTHADATVDAQGNYRLEASFTHEAITKERAIRIQSEGTSFNYSIDKIELYRSEAAAAALEVVYSLAKDSEFQALRSGSTFESSTWFMKSGSPAMRVYFLEDGSKAFRLTGRSQDWDAVDLRNLDKLEAGYEYVITVKGTAQAGGTMKLSQPGSPWGTHVDMVVGADGKYSLEASFSFEDLSREKSIRIQSQSSTFFFSVEEVTISRRPVQGAAAAAPVPQGATIEDVFITFSPTDRGEWQSNFSIPMSQNSAMQWVTNFGSDDRAALRGSHLSTSTDYTGANNAIRLTFDEPLAKNAIYTISYKVFVPRQGNERKSTLTGPGFVLNGDYPGATGVVKFPVDFGTIALDTWKTVSATTPTEGLTEALSYIDFRFVVNDAPNHPDVWFIDEIRISQQLIASFDAEPDYREYGALKDVYKNYFYLGTTSANSRMNGDKLDIIKYHFDSFTPENEMKPQSIQNRQGTFTWTQADTQLEKVADLTLVGHVLLWHSQSPAWMWGSPTANSPAVTKANIDAHIAAVLGRYGSRLQAIDVVNEAVADGKSDPDWRKNLRENEGYFTSLGYEWVEYAFLKAAEIVDRNGWNVKLYYNDYNLDYPDKARTVYNMVKDINERYAGRRPNGKQLIEGVGMQQHNNENTQPQRVEDSIKLFSTLPGVSISITELDITYSNLGTLTEEQQVLQAIKYARLFDIFKRYASGSANGGRGRIERVTFWGTNDLDSWRGSGFPLLFDRNLRAKEAFHAVLDPTGYLATHREEDYIRLSAAGEIELVDGIHIWDTDRGDDWSGANIILGNNANVWPFAVAGEDGNRAFTPERNTTYRISLNYTARGTNAIRIRWVKDNENGAYTSADAAVVNNYTYGPRDVATTIPAYFNRDMENGETYTLVNEIRLDGAQRADGLIGNIAIRGGLGGNAFSINWIKIEKLGPGGQVTEVVTAWPSSLK